MSEKYEYKYVRVPIQANYWSGEPSEEYRQVIDQEARLGWRLVQAFAPATGGFFAFGGFGTATTIDLIFEKRVPQFKSQLSQLPND